MCQLGLADRLVGSGLESELESRLGEAILVIKEEGYAYRALVRVLERTTDLNDLICISSYVINSKLI